MSASESGEPVEVSSGGMVYAYVEGRLSSGEHTCVSVYSIRVRGWCRLYRDTVPTALRDEQTHPRCVLFRIPTMFFRGEESRNKNREGVVLLHANPHKTHRSSS
jgi:hypothetical protein